MTDTTSWQRLAPREQARHPNTPPEELLKLAKEFPAEVFSNPALPLLTLESPGLGVELHFLRCAYHGERDGWAGLTLEAREQWLELARQRRFSLPGPVPAAAAPGMIFELPGRLITDTIAFYCAIGEAVNGPGGYFGCNLDALDDCCFGGFGAVRPFTIRWRDIHFSREALGHREVLRWTEDYLRSYDDLDPEIMQNLEERAALAARGEGETMSERILAVFHYYDDIRIEEC
jgi:RNAse (barnase) inhibitor barstar